jgi:phosphate acetyltransferase
MTNAIYLASVESLAGKSMIALGLMNLLSAKAEKIAYFRPVVSCERAAKDARVLAIKEYFKIKANYEDLFVFTQSEVNKLLGSGRESFVIDSIIERFKSLQSTHDYVLVEGTDFLSSIQNVEFKGNLLIAKNLSIPSVIILKGDNGSIEEIVEHANSAYQSFKREGVEVLALILNRVDEANREKLQQALVKRLGSALTIACVPLFPELENPTMQEILISTAGELVVGEKLLNNQVATSIVGAMQLHNCLGRLKKDTLVVTPGDRGDMITGMLQANISKNYPKLAGLVLTGGLEPEANILKLIDGLDSILPIIKVKTGTFETVARIANTKSRISADNQHKISLAISTFEKYVQIDELSQKMISFVPKLLTPRMFQYQIVERARKHKKHIVLPESEDPRILQAAELLIQQGVADITFIGQKDQIFSNLKKTNSSLELESLHIIDPSSSDLYQDFVNTLYELRKHKNLSIQMAKDLMLDVSYFGTMLVYKGLADAMVSGAIHTTQHTIRPALQFIKTKPGVSLVSSVFIMCLDKRVVIFGDCAVNPNPSAEELADIAISSAATSLMLGIEPKIAMLSYSSGSSGEGQDVDKVRKATEIIRSKRPDLKVEGPIQYDAAVDPEVGLKKLPNSDVAGQATVLIFPDLNTGNNTYKAVQRETGAVAIGPILQGLNKPINDLSRGCTVDDIFNTVVISAIQAQQNYTT